MIDDIIMNKRNTLENESWSSYLILSGSKSPECRENTNEKVIIFYLFAYDVLSDSVTDYLCAIVVSSTVCKSPVLT